jgi:hypothetical protein
LVSPAKSRRKFSLDPSRLHLPCRARKTPFAEIS